MDDIVVTDKDGNIIFTSPTITGALKWMHHNPKTEWGPRFMYDAGRLVQII